MTTPTREQVIEWAKAANILQSVDLLETNQWRHDFIRELTCLCTLAMSAGRDQGLREAKEVCLAERRLGLDDERAYCGELMAAAIDLARTTHKDEG